MTPPDQAVSMTQGPRAPRTQVALASLVRPGDHVVASDGRFIEVVRVRRAQGRKPAHGENLHLVGAEEIIKVNSLDGVRILARPS